MDGGVESILEVLTSTSRFAIDLRQNTPFAGVLTEAERQAVLRAFAATTTPKTRPSGAPG